MAAATSYVLQGPYAGPWRGPGTLQVTNVDPNGAIITVATVGADGNPPESIALDTEGDAVTVDLGTVASFSITASAYPATILLLVTSTPGVGVTANPPVQASGGHRLLGSVTLSANGTQSLAVNLQESERSIVVVVPYASGATYSGLSVSTQVRTTGGVVVGEGGATGWLAPMYGGGTSPSFTLAYASPDLGTGYVVAVNVSGLISGSIVAYVYADTTFPMFVPVTNPYGPLLVAPPFSGQAQMAQAFTTVPASDFLGPKASIGSVPVVIASDQSPVGTRPQSVLNGRIVSTFNNVVPGSASVTLGTIAAQGTSSLYRLVRAHHSVSARGAIGANIAVSALSLIDQHGGSVQLTYLMVQPGAPQHAEVTWPAPFDVGHYLNTGDTWSLIVGSALTAGTPGNLDGIGVLEWEHI